MNAMSKIDLSKVTVQDKVQAMCLAYPHMHSREMAKCIGIPTPSVSKLRSELGLQRIPDGKSIAKHLGEENCKWLEIESEKAGVCIPEMLVAIVTDARNGD